MLHTGAANGAKCGEHLVVALLLVIAADGEGGIFPEAMLEGLDAAWSMTAAGYLKILP